MAGAQTIVSRRERTPWRGVRVIEGVTANPTTEFVAALVSLCEDYVHIAATRPASSFVTPSRWGTSEGVQLATNGDFFASGPRVYGNAIGRGRAWPLRQTGADPGVSSEWYYRRYGWIGFGAGVVEFSHTEWVKQRASALGVREGWRPGVVTTEVPRGITELVSGFPELITEGTRYTCSSPTASSCFPDRSDMRARHPRTAMGLTRDRRTFILLTVDGRSSRSAGMYGTELARTMELLGAWQAFNLDGGGSSAFWQRGRGVLNRPSDGAERAVANHWGVFAGSDNGRPRVAGSCVPIVGIDAGVVDAGVADAGVADAARDAPPGRDVPPVLTDVPPDQGLGRDVPTTLDGAVSLDGSIIERDRPAVMNDDVQDAAVGDDAAAGDADPSDSSPGVVSELGDPATQPGCACEAGPTRRGAASWWGLFALTALSRLRRRRAPERGKPSTG